MNVFKAVGFLVMLMTLLTVNVFAADLGDYITINSVELDDDIIDQAPTVNRVQFERNDVIEVEVRLSSNESIEDAEIMARISGYEFNDLEPMSDTSSIFDMEANVTYKKTLNIRVPIEVEEDDYRLRIYISDRNNGALIQDYELKLDSPRHGFQIEDVVFSPGNVVEAGRVLLSTVRVENKGERDEDSVKVSVSIPDLGITASDFIDEIEYSDSETSEEMYMRIPPCAPAGDYTVLVEVRYNELREAIVEKGVITVTEGSVCDAIANQVPTTPAAPTVTQPKTVIALGATTQELVKNSAGAIYPLTITNQGSDAKAYSIMVDGVSEFATVAVNPVSTFILNAGDSQSVFVYLTAKDEATLGQRIFTITVASGNEIMKQIPLTVSVSDDDMATAPVQPTSQPSEKNTNSLGNTLEMGLIVLIVILIILGIVVLIKHVSKDGDDEMDDDDTVEGKTYY